MTIIAKNLTGAEIRLDDLAGARIPASGQYELTISRTEFEIYESTDLKTEIASGNIILNDGTSDLSQDESEELVQEVNVSKTRDGVPVVMRSFNALSDQIIHDGDEFTLKWDTSDASLKVFNKNSGWFDAAMVIAKDQTLNGTSDDISSAVGEYFFSENGALDTTFALNEVYSSFAIFSIITESNDNEAFWGMVHRSFGQLHVILFVKS